MSMFLKLLISFVVFLEVVNCHPSVDLKRIRRQSADEKEDSGKTKGSNPVEAFSDVIRGTSKAIRNLISIKQNFGEDILPIITTVGDTIQNAYKSGLVQTSSKLVRTAADKTCHAVLELVLELPRFLEKRCSGSHNLF